MCFLCSLKVTFSFCPTGNIACGYDNGNEFVTIEFLEKNVKECFKETVSPLSSFDLATAHGDKKTTLVFYSKTR